MSWVVIVFGANRPYCQPRASNDVNIYIAQTEKRATWKFHTHLYGGIDVMLETVRVASSTHTSEALFHMLMLRQKMILRFQSCCQEGDPYDRCPHQSLPIWHIVEITAGDTYGYFLLQQWNLSLYIVFIDLHQNLLKTLKFKSQFIPNVNQIAFDKLVVKMPTVTGPRSESIFRLRGPI